MSETSTKKSKSGNRYPGVDSTPWKVTGTASSEPLKDPKGNTPRYTSFTDANNAARAYNLAGDGSDYASAVRA